MEKKCSKNEYEIFLMLLQEVSTARSLPEILDYFTVYGLENDTKSSSSNEQQFYLVNKHFLED